MKQGGKAERKLAIIQLSTLNCHEILNQLSFTSILPNQMPDKINK